MKNSVKNAIYTVIVLAIVMIVWLIRDSSDQSQLVKLSGTTMGTTYNITYFGQEIPSLKSEIDSVLFDVNKSASTYMPDSEISQFNNGDSLIFTSSFFYPLLLKSEEIWKFSEGSFDPTVMPLVNFWGFGPAEASESDSIKIDSLLQYVGFEKISYSNKQVNKSIKGVQLDFSAIAKGYGVDIVTQFMNSKGLQNVFVEIGGEVRVTGENPETSQPWKIGIINPQSDRESVSLFGVLSITDESVATSGNYFNYYIKNGIKYSHTIHPKVGFPAIKNILSASIVAKDCMTADAFATACMVMGHEMAIEKLESQADLKGIIIYSSESNQIEMYISPELLNQFHREE